MASITDKLKSSYARLANRTDLDERVKQTFSPNNLRLLKSSFSPQNRQSMMGNFNSAYQDWKQKPANSMVNSFANKIAPPVPRQNLYPQQSTPIRNIGNVAKLHAQTQANRFANEWRANSAALKFTEKSGKADPLHIGNPFIPINQRTGVEPVNLADMAVEIGGLSGGLTASTGAGKLPTFSSRIDKKIRFEISDRQASLKAKGLKSAIKSGASRLEDVFDHKGLYNKYPQFKKLRVVFEEGGSGAGGRLGSFDPKTFTVKIDPRIQPGQMRSTILHEVQHAIQESEGFATGTSSKLAGTTGYLRNAGELEARAAQRREAMAPALRQRTDPLSAEALATTGRTDPSDFTITKDGMLSFSEKPPKRVEQTFKTEKFNLNPQQAKTLDKLRKTLGYETRPVRTFDDMQKMAEELGADPNKLLKDIQTGRITDAEVVALSNITNTSSQRVAILTKQLKKDPTNKEIIAKLAQEEELIRKAVVKQLRGGTAGGRSVVAFRILANRTLDPAYWLNKAQRQVGEGRALKSDEIQAIIDLTSQKDRLGLARYVSLLGESSLREKATGLWKAGLLTSLRTHEANVISNTIFGGLETIKDIPATGFDVGRAAITGKPRTKALNLGTITSQGGGAVEGAKQAKQYFTEGIDVRDLGKLDAYKPLRFGDTKAGRAAQKYTDTIFGALGSEDKVFREMAVARSLNEQAAVRGINKNLTAKQIQELIDNPTKEMLEMAVKDAEYATFNNPNAISDAIRAAKASGGENVSAVLDFTMPFVRTPTNVAKAMIDYTPPGFVYKAVKKIVNGKAVSDKELANAFGRSVTGTAILWAGFQLAKDGKIQGASPSSEAERSQMYLEGKQANSILINGQWRSVGRFSPFGNLLILGAEYYNSGKQLGQTTAAGVKSLSEQTFLKGLSAATGAVNDPARGAKKYFESAIGGVVPNIVKDTARGGDDYMRDTDTTLDVVKQGLPGLRNTLPAKLDALGNPVKQEGGYGTAFFDPTNPKTATNDPLVKEFARVGYNLNYVGDTLSNEKLTPTQQRNYQRLAGKYIQEFGSELIQSSDYKSLDIDSQNSMIEKVVNKAKDLAREEIKQDPTILNAKDSGIGVGAAENTTERSTPKLSIKDRAGLGSSNEVKIVKLPDKKSTTTPSKTYTYISDGTLKTINVGKVASMPNKTNYEKTLKEKEAYKLVDDVLDNLEGEKQAQALKSLGISKNQAEYYNVARQENDTKYSYVTDELGKYKNHGELLNFLAESREEVNGKMVAADGVLDQLYEDGTITYQERKMLKALKYDKKTGKVIAKRGGTGKKPAKFISDAQILSAYKKALAAAYKRPQRTEVRSIRSATKPIKLKRSKVKMLY